MNIVLLFAAALFFSNNSSLAAVHSKKKLNVVINNAAISSADILSKNNQVFISLTGARVLDDLTFKWNNATKQVSVKGKETDLLLTMNKTTAQKNGASINLSAAPLIHYGKVIYRKSRFKTD